ncbi:MAG TPA: copper resistance system multicopper oxidase [Gammaproteobacteria bacterium]|nr:copper resistance system multicopper oxidase [Gammaproteobacteria bacterium]
MDKLILTRRLDGPVTRRRFLEATVGGGVAAGFAPAVISAGTLQGARAQATLSGRELDLTTAYAAVDFTGKMRAATLVNGSLPAPVLRWREGDTLRIRLRNELDEDTSIHWHGILLPANMDGVPGLSFAGVAPGGSYLYEFTLRQSGTYWYHSHSRFQEQTGMYGPLIIDPIGPEPFDYDREHVVMLSDWTDRDPMSLYRLLKKQSHYFNFNRRTIGTLVDDIRQDGFLPTFRERTAWGRMRMSPSDLADVSGYGYTYLLNGTAPADNWTGLFSPGERVRLRFINGSSMTFFDVRIPGLEMTVVAADGQNVHPVTIDEFRLAVAETLDVIVTPTGADAFTIFAQSMDRSGYARGTLATRGKLEAPVPQPDRVVYLTMADMGHGAMAEGAMGEGAMEGHEIAPPAAHAGMNHAGTDHAATGHAASDGEMPQSTAMGAMQQHPPSEARNPGVDMQTMQPAAKLDDPGVGLRDNGRRVLTYADLRTLGDDPDGREPGRTIELHLTGHMERYLWSFDGVRFSDSAPLELRYGERVRITLVNDTMMDHPIHLHGMWSDLEDESGRFLVRKHTVSMPPGSKRSYRVTADALGRWAYHCHLLYHMEAGMFREVRVDT